MAAAVAAIDALDTARVAAVSPLYRTAPWGDTDQPDFLNACLRIETCLPPLDLLDRLKAIEKELKRRKTRRWGPRTIDLDILVYQGEAVAHERLAIPHPRMLDRVFVLRPLADIDPALEIAGRTVADWLSRLESDDGIGKEAGPDWAGVKPGGQ
ncbi:MAG: 2-amino-4-hydroxy-6-hydroxymethyldihydropteridine diphosphokinase [Nitratireductor sp.]|nr:2-amino-4-hydroxy-6-hydroxymethyldihydropteridine diphosphokinase [Nitratireductor sp.]